MTKARLVSGAVALSLVACGGREVERSTEESGTAVAAAAAAAAAAATPTTTAQSPDAMAMRERFLIRISQGELDAALDEYRSLRSVPMLDFSSLHLAPQLAALRDDSRFAELFPTDFSDPFVERRKVIHDWSGEGAGQEFGWEARAIGDVDRDGIADAVVSAPANQPGGGAAGKVYVYSGRSGALLWSADGKPEERLGTGIEAAGDVDGDGSPDFLVTSAWSLIHGVRSGRAMIVSGAL